MSSASDELVAQVAQLLFDLPCAGPAFFLRLMQLNGSVAWCCRLLSPVTDQLGASFGGSEWQFCAFRSPEPHFFHLLQSTGRWDPTLHEPNWLHYCVNVEALSMLLKQFDVDTKWTGTTALFGWYRTQHDKVAFDQVTRALLDAGADPRLLVGHGYLPPLAVLEVVFERVAPQTLFPTAADLLCPVAHENEGPAIVLLLLKHGYSVDEVRCTCCSCRVSHDCEGLCREAAGQRLWCGLWFVTLLCVVRSAVPQAHQGHPAWCGSLCGASHRTLHGPAQSCELSRGLAAAHAPSVS